MLGFLCIALVVFLKVQVYVHVYTVHVVYNVLYNVNKLTLFNCVIHIHCSSILRSWYSVGVGYRNVIVQCTSPNLYYISTDVLQ